jgi:FeS assembly SUF system regulator
MIRMSKLTDYGILLMSLVARDSEQRPRAARDLADEANLPLPTVSKILKILLGHDLLVSHRGVKGGYNLARAAQEISVAQVIEAMEGPIGLTECSADTGNCELMSFCPMRSNWSVISDAVRDALENVKLADLAAPLHLAKKGGNMVFLGMPTGRMQ